MDNAMLEKIFPWLLVHYEVDMLYLKRPEEAMDFIMEKLDEEAILDQKNVMVVSYGFEGGKKKFLDYLNKFSEDEFASYSTMLLYEAVSIFESGINNWFNNELTISYGLSHEQANEVLTKLSVRDKINWLLKLITGESFIDQKSWSTIKPMISSRNIFIHFKPIDIHHYFKHKKNLTKKSIIDFLDACSICISFLEERKGQDVEKYNDKIHYISEVFKNRNRR